MAALSTNGKLECLRELIRRWPARAGAVLKPAWRTLIDEADAYLDAMDATRPATSYRAACTAPFNGVGDSVTRARMAVLGVVAIQRAIEGV